ncbi:hypothetical protein WAK64_00875 [Bacillus spongiae]|uniref:Uncharacterized protein n=1 Tax=Bacillus spongiae TaxID=2683610 RepID=A0ABU8H8P4_9BACI
MKQLKKLFLSIPFLVMGLFFISTNEVSAGTGPEGDCGAKVWTDYTNYYMPGAKTVDFYVSKPSSSCDGSVYYDVRIEKKYSFGWQFTTLNVPLNGEFAFRTPTKQIDIDKYFGSSGTYRINILMHNGQQIADGEVESHDIYIHY